MGDLYEHIIQLICFYVKTYGWYFLFFVILLYNLSPYFNSYLARKSFEHAQRPERRAAFDEEVVRVRERQQADIAAAAAEAASIEREEKEARLQAGRQRKTELDLNVENELEKHKRGKEEALKALIAKHKQENQSSLGVDSSIRQRKRGG